MRELVRGAMPASTSCGTMAQAFWSVGTRVGLPLRVVQASANGLNSYDSHVTVEVWLARRHRWVVSDPTFDGWWSGGRNGPPVGTDALQRAAAGGDERLWWHGSGAARAVKPSVYYVDPVYLYRLRLIRSAAPSFGTGSLVGSQAGSFGHGTLFVARGDRVLQTTPPGAGISVRVLPRLAGPSRVGALATRLPPAYAGEKLFEQRVRLRPDGTARLVLTGRSGTFVLGVSAHGGKWSLRAAGVSYPLVATRGGHVSPIAPLPRIVTLVARGAPEGTALVRVWAAKRFPRERELVGK